MMRKKETYRHLAFCILLLMVTTSLDLVISINVMEGDAGISKETSPEAQGDIEAGQTRGLQADCLYYNFEEGGGNLVRDLSTSGGNDGTRNGGAAYTTSAKVGRWAMSFPAQWTAHVQVPDTNNNLHQANAYTFMAWIKVTGSGRSGLVMLGGCCNQRNGYSFQTDGNGIRFWGGCDQDNSNYNTNAGNNVCDGNWHHVAITCNPSQLKIYIDGNQVSTGGENIPTTPRDGGNSNRNSPVMSIGGDNVDRSCQQTRIIDEVAVFGRELTVNEIREAMQGLISIPSTENVNLIDPTGSGKTCYARYTPYTISVNVTTCDSLNEINDVKLFVDYNTTNATLGYNWSQQRFYKMQDVNDHLELFIDNCTITNDLKDRWWLNFSVMFNFTFPHERMVDCFARTISTLGEMAQDRFPFVFRVENDMELVGTLDFEGEYQGPLQEGDWVRGNETLKITNLTVIYEDADGVYPHNDFFDVNLTDSTGNTWWDNESSGEEISINISSRDVTDEEEEYLTRIVNIPGGGICITNLTYGVKVDAEPPVSPANLVCHADGFKDKETENTNQAEMYVTWDPVVDTASGLIGYYYSLADNSGTTNGSFTNETETDINKLEEGFSSVYVWCIDNVGNIGRPSTAGIRVDLTPPVFANMTPGDGDWHNHTDIECSAEILDRDGSGVDGNTIEYSVSLGGAMNYDLWMQTRLPEPAERLVPNVMYVFQEGEDNFIKWRAKDVSGNGYVESFPVNIKIDITPVMFEKEIVPHEDWYGRNDIKTTISVSDEGSGVDQNSLQARFSVTGTDGFGPWFDIAGDNITEIGSGKYEMSVTFTYAEGKNNYVMFRGTDIVGNPLRMSDKFNLKIDTTPVYFGVYGPDEESYSNEREVECFISILDDGAGVDVNSVEYSISTNGPDEDEFKSWKRVTNVIAGNPAQVLLPLEFEWGRDNYIKWKANDRMGTGQNISRPYRIWINSEPVPVVTSPDTNLEYWSHELILFDASNSSDADGDDLTFKWGSNVSSNRTLGNRSTFSARLAPGKHLITVHVFDGHDYEISEKIFITVNEKKEPPVISSKDEGALSSLSEGGSGSFWFFIIGGIAILIIIVLAVLFLMRKKKKEREEEERKSRQQAALPPSHPYPQGGYLPGFQGGYGGPSPHGRDLTPGMMGGPGMPPQQLALPPGPQTPMSQQPPAPALPGPGVPGPGQVATPVYSLPAFSTDQGSQDLNMMALPPGPEPTVGPGAPDDPFAAILGMQFPSASPETPPPSPITMETPSSILESPSPVPMDTPAPIPMELAVPPDAGTGEAPPPGPPPSPAELDLAPYDPGEGGLDDLEAFLGSMSGVSQDPPPGDAPPPPPVPGAEESGAKTITMQCHSCNSNYNAEITGLPAIVSCTHCGTQGMIESI